MKIERIVVGVDGSANSLAAVAWTAGLAAATGAEVIAVHAVGLLERTESGELAPSRSHLGELEERFSTTWCAPLGEHEIRWRHVLRNGSAVPVLLSVAAEEAADLLVVGSRGVGEHPARLLGSTSTQVAQHAIQPVVVVPCPVPGVHGLQVHALGERHLLRDGRSVIVRPLRPDDEPLVDALLALLPDDAVRTRLDAEPRGDGSTLLAVDDEGAGVGMARCWPRGARTAEVTVAVAPTWRGVGLGGKLLVLLGLRATEQGVRRFTATYPQEQHGIDRLVIASGFPYRLTGGPGTTSVEIDLVGPASRRAGAEGPGWREA